MKKFKKKHSFRMAIIVLCAVLVLPLVLVNCERVNDISQSGEQNFNAKFEQTGDPYDYVFVNPKWEVIDKNHTDAFGNQGELYVNANNSRESYFYVKIQAKACTSYKGYWDTQSLWDAVTRTTITIKVCRQSQQNQTCGVTICQDEQTKALSTSIYSLENPQ